MLKLISILLTLIGTVTLNAQSVKPIYVVHVNLGNTQLSKYVVEELLRPNSQFKNRPVILLRPNLDVKDNPFAVSKWSHQAGLTRQNSELKNELTPLMNQNMLKWFDDLEAKNIQPEVFIINGHHLLGMGFESDNTWDTGYANQFGENIELGNRALYFQTVIQSKNKFPILKRFFDRIKLVFIGGCEGLANLEPKENGLSGRALTPVEIKQRYFGGQKNLMLGDISKGAGLAGYKADLVRVYPGSYVDKESDEACVDRVNKMHCETYDVNRILPDSGLWDGQHIYNMPLQMKKLFSNAYGVFGFYTPSPREPGAIWKYAFDRTRQKLKTDNFFQRLLSDEVSVDQKKEIIQTMRISWTSATQLMNKRYRNGKVVTRISGSLTPSFPDLDKNGIFAYEESASDFPEGPRFAPYEVRDDNQAYKKESTGYNPSEKEDPLFNFIKKIEQAK